MVEQPALSKSPLEDLPQVVQKFAKSKDDLRQPRLEFLDKILEACPEIHETLDKYGGVEQPLELVLINDKVMEGLYEDPLNLEGLGAMRHNKYHHLNHRGGVKKVGQALADHQGFGPIRRQLLDLFGDFHDLFHSGKIGGSDWDNNIKKTLRTTFTICHRRGVPLANTLVLLDMIAASTSFHPDFEGRNQMNMTAEMADLGAFSEGLKAYITGGLEVTLEMLGGDFPKTFPEFLASQEKFLEGYLGPKLEAALEVKVVPEDWKERQKMALELVKSPLVAEDPLLNRAYRHLIAQRLSAEELATLTCERVGAVLGLPVRG